MTSPDLVALPSLLLVRRGARMRVEVGFWRNVVWMRWGQWRPISGSVMGHIALQDLGWEDTSGLGCGAGAAMVDGDVTFAVRTHGLKWKTGHRVAWEYAHQQWRLHEYHRIVEAHEVTQWAPLPKPKLLATSAELRMTMAEQARLLGDDQ